MNYKELSSEINEFLNLEWKGKPNSRSKEHVCWDVIYRTAEAIKKLLTIQKGKFPVDQFQSSGICSENAFKGFTVREVVRKMSVVDMDGVTVMERETFYQILLYCIPSGKGEKHRRQLSLPFRAFLGCRGSFCFVCS